MHIFRAIDKKPEGHILKSCGWFCQKSSRYEKMTQKNPKNCLTKNLFVISYFEYNSVILVHLCVTFWAN